MLAGIAGEPAFEGDHGPDPQQTCIEHHRTRARNHVPGHLVELGDPVEQRPKRDVLPEWDRVLLVVLADDLPLRIEDDIDVLPLSLTQRAIAADQEPGPDPSRLLGDRIPHLRVLHRIGVQAPGRSLGPHNQMHGARFDGPGQVEVLEEGAQPLVRGAMLEGTWSGSLDDRHVYT